MLIIKFSVLMSVYKKENPIYLSDSLESILVNQNLKPNELVLVKDGPLTDELEKVIKRYQSYFTNFKVVPLEKNMGLGLALREGLNTVVMSWLHEWIRMILLSPIVLRSS